MPRQRTVTVALIAILAGIGASFAVYRYSARSRPGNLSVTFVSEPPGATLVSADSKNVLGVSPVTVAYTRPDRWTTCVSYRGFRASWPDGRELAVNLIELCPDGGVNQELRFSAPDLSSAQRRGSSRSTSPKDRPEDMQRLLEYARGVKKELEPPTTSADSPAIGAPAAASSRAVH
jgi:hypothetical protein